MKITVDLPEKELRDIYRITGISKKGPAIRKLLDDALTLQRRAAISTASPLRVRLLSRQ